MNDHETDYDSLWMRLINMIIIGILLSFTQTILWVLSILQFVIMVFNKRVPNEQLSEFGTTMGVWMAKAVRYQTAASEVKPWPWTELDQRQFQDVLRACKPLHQLCTSVFKTAVYVHRFGRWIAQIDRQEHASLGRI